MKKFRTKTEPVKKLIFSCMLGCLHVEESFKRLSLICKNIFKFKIIMFSKKVSDEETHQICPVCFKIFPISKIEEHVNKCIFLNSSEENVVVKRKRSVSPLLSQSSASQVTKKVENISEESNNILISEKSPSRIKQNPVQSYVPLAKKNPVQSNVPLAKKIQPKCLEDFFGQSQVLGPNSVLYSLISRGDVPNMILWGPPGCGKTSLASIIEEMCKDKSKCYKFVNLCAANTNVKEVTDAIAVAKNDLKFGRKTILFMDEIHRFNKRQQDTFLMHVEKGDIILIGATTENPSFCVNSALLSRCRVIVFEKLKPEDVLLILRRAVRFKDMEIIWREEDIPKNVEKTVITNKSLEWLADISDGDARIALNNLELILQHNNNEKKVITTENIQEELKKSHLLYDRKGEEHYNLISAVHKSIRGSDDTAALYWTTRMIMSGEDPMFIARRLVRAASEDIGNADPNALQLAVSTMQGCQLLGMPEADCLLAQCAIYLARAPKSREADSALAAAKKVIRDWKGPQPDVPLHLRNAPTKLMKNLGYGKLEAGNSRSFLPDSLQNINFFE